MPEKKVVVYTDSECPACKDFVPDFERAAKAAGIKYEKVNVDRCPTDDKMCQTVKLVPTVTYGGREVEITKVPEFLRRLAKRG